MSDQPKDIFQKLFGEAPTKGYEFTHIKASIGWRSVVISWVAKGIGFGETAIFIEKKKIKIDTECMSKAFCDAVVEECIRQMKKEEDLEEQSEESIYEGSNKLNSSFIKEMYENVSWDKNQK